MMTESEGSDTDGDVEAVSDAEIRKVREALIAKYGAYFRPGERMPLELERQAEYSRVQMVLESGEDSTRLELEAAALEEDDGSRTLTPRERFDAALDLVDAQLHQYFTEERTARFHPDWRPYEFDGVEVRFRGQVRRPELERIADAWLESGGDPNPDKN